MVVAARWRSKLSQAGAYAPFKETPMNLTVRTFTLISVTALALCLYPRFPAAGSAASGRGTAATQRTAPPQRAEDRIRLKSRTFVPAPGIDPALQSVAPGPRHGLIQFHRIPTRPERQALRRAGVELLTYIPDRAFLAVLPADVNPVLRHDAVRYVGPLLPTDKIERRILGQGVNPFARNPDGTLRLSVLFFEDVDPRRASELLKEFGGRVTEVIAAARLVRAHVPERALQALLAEDTVQWVEDVFEPKIFNDGARVATRVAQAQAAPYSLDGTGSVVGEWDGGHAISTSNVVTHQDLAGRVTRGDTTTAGFDAHATHVAGTVLGSGALSASQGGSPLQWRGMAPAATLVAYDWNSFLSEYQAAIGTHNIDLSTNSWGFGSNGNYFANSRAVDQIVTGIYGKRLPIAWAAGNQRGGSPHACDQDLDANTSTNFDAFDCIIDPATAKNVITIGATNSNGDSMTAFSSWGPTNDGRLKPEIVAPGCQSSGDGGIKSTVPTNVYGISCGTSMATPVASGSAALLIQRFGQLCPTSASGGGPLPSTLKALFVHGARDLDDTTAWYNRGPDFASGYGRLDLLRSVDLIPSHVEGSAAHQGVQTYQIVVTPQQDLKVTLAWDDEAAAPNASPALVNDLDLELVDPQNNVHLPWVLNPAAPSAAAVRGVDNRNVVEQVLVDNVAPALAGTWTIRVKGTNVPSLTQQFSLVSELLPTTSCAGPTPAADIWGADTVNDTGAEPNPTNDPMWISDDIRVRLAPADGPHQNAEFGQINYVFVTVRNSGTQTGPYAKVFLYWIDASTAVAWPTDWNQFGTGMAVNVPAGGSTVVGPIPWNPPGVGHYCLYARMITHHEPFGPETPDIFVNTKQWDQIIWRNVTIVDILSVKAEQYSFNVRNPGTEAAAFDLVFAEPREQQRQSFLERGQVFVDLGGPLYERWQRGGGKQRGLAPAGGTVFRVTEPRATLLGLQMRPRETFAVRMRFVGREVPRGSRYRFDVIQESAQGRKQVGGVSYVLQAGTRGRDATEKALTPVNRQTP
jgi:Subtilase family